ncbi:hypothetical protein [Halomonas litopenaei]|uniref:hypothetical protein n=1 Tax=Halomonas litopenaei TaxID=2109328 RepID=UPI001A8EB53F|nr:hypothetical protein [Halomonas litopenaei]MBN8411444.1 hypothetical protein [Halomonas litopenaei]
MANDQYITTSVIENGISRLCRVHAVEQHTIQSEIQTLMIIASYACDFLTEELKALPEDFFACIEEMKEVMESIDLRSLDFEKQTIALQRTKRRLEAKATRQNRQKEV